MKARVFIFSVFAFAAFYGNGLAQDNKTVDDQNPRHLEALAKYSSTYDSLTRTQGTTAQDTYKAYDWYEAREQRRRERRDRINFYRSNFPYYSPYSYGIGYGFGAGWASPNWGWGSRIGCAW